MAQYEPKQVDVTVVLDDTLCKGAESWAWYGLQPVHHALKPGRTLIVISLQDAPALLKNIHRRDEPYKLAVVKGVTSFSGMWVYKDDHTDVRVLGAIAKALPELVSLKSVEQFITEKLKNPLKVTSARTAFERFTAVDVKRGRGQSRRVVQIRLARLGGTCGKACPSTASRRADHMPIRKAERSAASGRRATSCSRSTQRAPMRPVVNFATCTKCTLCWLNCPDASFDVTPDGTYDANLEVVLRMRRLRSRLPGEDCITMVNESEFNDNDSQWAAFRKDKDAYLKWLETTIEKAEPIEKRAHGFRYRGQYQEEVPEALEIARKG